MFQSFEASTSPDQGPPRLRTLRRELAAEGLDGFLVPRADAHQGEYVAPRDDRLAWLTGFTGSAGFCAVLQDIAGVFVDGRYRVQVKAQVAPDFTPVNWPETKLGPWLAEHLPHGGKVGFDPWLHTAQEIETVEKAVAGQGHPPRPGREPDRPDLGGPACPAFGPGHGPSCRPRRRILARQARADRKDPP
jgi:Xaa-Pro aminopeptidase